MEYVHLAQRIVKLNVIKLWACQPILNIKNIKCNFYKLLLWIPLNYRNVHLLEYLKLLFILRKVCMDVAGILKYQETFDLEPVLFLS